MLIGQDVLAVVRFSGSAASFGVCILFAHIRQHLSSLSPDPPTVLFMVEACLAAMI